MKFKIMAVAVTACVLVFSIPADRTVAGDRPAALKGKPVDVV